jgi:hypothetical protein
MPVFHQLIAGFTRNQPNYGLLVFMRDYDDLGKPVKAGETIPPGGNGAQRARSRW